MDEAANRRMAEILPLQQALAASWGPLEKHLQDRKDDLVVRLIVKNDEETRGRIKEIDDLLALPQRLQREAVDLQQPQQEAAELP